MSRVAVETRPQYGPVHRARPANQSIGGNDVGSAFCLGDQPGHGSSLRRDDERIEVHNATLNAIVTLDAERAREEADAADAARARGEDRGVLDGLPITVKDNYETPVMRTVCGRKDLADNVPRQGAETVSRLRRSGAIIIGKTNMPPGNQDVQADTRSSDRPTIPGTSPGHRAARQAGARWRRPPGWPASTSARRSADRRVSRHTSTGSTVTRRPGVRSRWWATSPTAWVPSMG